MAIFKHISIRGFAPTTADILTDILEILNIVESYEVVSECKYYNVVNSEYYEVDEIMKKAEDEGYDIVLFIDEDNPDFSKFVLVKLGEKAKQYESIEQIADYLSKLIELLSIESLVRNED